MQGSVGEFQKLQPRCRFDRRYSCPCSGSVPLSVRRHPIDRWWVRRWANDTQTQQLEDDVEDAAKMLVGDIDLFGETEAVGEA